MKDIIRDDVYLTCPDDIIEYFTDVAGDLFDCGQGYYQDTAKVTCAIGDDLFEVTITADIGSEKQDRGDRLYFVDEITNVTYVPVTVNAVKAQVRSDLLARIGIMEARLFDLRTELAELDKA